MKTLYQFLEQGEPAQEPKKEDPKVKQAQAKENMLKKRVLMTKIRAVRGGAEGIMASYEPEGEMVEGWLTKKKPEKKAEKAMDAGAKARRKVARRVHAKYVSGSEDNVPDDIREGDVHSGQGEKIQKRTKKWMDKKGQKGAPGLDAMKARTAEHKAKRGVREEVVLEKDLNAAERRALPDKDFALPGKGKGPEGKQAGSYPIPDLTHARAALAMVAKYGTPEEKEKVRAAVKRKFPEIHQESKKNPNRLVEPRDGVDSAKEVNRATRKAAFRPFNKEDKAFDYVVAKLRKQHGNDAVLTKGQKPKPPTAAQKKKNDAIRAQRAKEDHRDETEKATSGRYNDRSRSD